eukprot:CAMPEP_0119103270 /NCGR_PEP_ID=MMETSP1180-20130426/1744_1 /TAXON_ID=3052 ORGANISM="Chlamydomonas cf sp, Strain CCMP681" /NCGR_SAMPLE_ID=MMETSP1180 /ASSEMBLY_ACC=CAM_ASM_000741 /LENGTH=419 /DNA_ID=CAMNT_0007087725 /DNA_START=55 /DNA_END=1314 /DNA_ORIENTATION=+
MTPDTFAQLIVQQWLSDNGHRQALTALEKEIGLLWDEDKLDRGGILMDLVWSHMESTSDDSPTDVHGAEEESLLRGGTGDYPQVVMHTIEGVHPTSVVCVRLLPGRDEVLTGSGDGIVRRVGFDASLFWATPVGSGGALCLDLHPHLTSASWDQAEAGGVSSCLPCHVVAVGSMDGSLSLLHAYTGQLLASDRSHLKYVVRVAWAGDGQHLVTCSHDQSVGIHWVEVPQGGSDAPRAIITTVRKVEYLAAVQDVAFLPDGVSLCVAVRDTNYLRVLSFQHPESAERLVNLNKGGDDHVSFFPRHLVPSPCGRFLLVSTDTERMLVLRTSDWTHTKYVLYSSPTQQFHQPAAAWHKDSHYVMVSSVGGQVWVYHVGSGKVVAKIPVHKVNVRDIHYEKERNLLITCSFDKTVQVLGAKTM